ncbi:MAG: HAD family hydrolase [Candidatus Nanoarchaeia archaeon]
MKAVIFDVDGVLLDSFEANLKFFQDLLSKAKYPPPTREEYSKMMHLSMHKVIEIFLKSEPHEEIQRVFDMGRTREVPYPLDLLKTPYDAEKTILDLEKSYVLGIVSSRVKGSIFEAPQLAKLKDKFKVVITYEDTTLHKPHPEPLLLAAERLGLHPKDMTYVGDTESDILAAKAAGMKVILYSKEKIPGADAHTSSFGDISDIISRL